MSEQNIFPKCGHPYCSENFRSNGRKKDGSKKVRCRICFNATERKLDRGNRLKAKALRAERLERLLAAVDAGRTGVDLSQMSDKEIIEHLSRQRPTPMTNPTPDLRKVLELASDVRWEEIAKGSDFTVIDRMLLLELYTTARAARDAYNSLTGDDAVIERMAKALRSFVADDPDAAILTAATYISNRDDLLATTAYNALTVDDAVIERMALAIERADREHAPDGTIDHPEISDWGEHLARAALNALHSPLDAEG